MIPCGMQNSILVVQFYLTPLLLDLPGFADGFFQQLCRPSGSKVWLWDIDAVDLLWEK